MVSGSIVLFHNDGEHTPEILEELIAGGYKPVAVTELLGESLGIMKPGGESPQLYLKVTARR